METAHRPVDRQGKAESEGCPEGSTGSPVRKAMLCVMKRTNRCRLILVGGLAAIALAVAVGLWAGPFTAAGAMPDDEKTWVGDVERHGRHYDYIGRSCPIEQADPCPEYIVRYEIVPTTTQAARALPKVSGHRARLIGNKEHVRKPGHSGTLMVSEVQSKEAPPGPLDTRP
jgi:hypothetical protein